MAHDPLEHVLDTHQWEFFHFFGWEVQLPRLFTIHLFGKPYDVYITKFEVLEVLAAVLVAAIFIPLCRRASKGTLPRGPWWNAFESLLTFIRDEVAKPTLGEHHADRYVPFLWTEFLFVLFCNLLGLVPMLGSPTASLYMTLGLALFSFGLMHGAAIADMGLFHYLKSLWPHVPIEIRIPGLGNLVGSVASLVISLMIYVIELIGTVIKAGVLAVRLFANMFAGHTVLAMLLLFIVFAGETGLSFTWAGVTFASVAGVVALSLLELFVAFLQAYIFVFLTALFMGMALHPEH
jgi:F-type H+-transporting ATPase subunit a